MRRASSWKMSDLLLPVAWRLAWRGQETSSTTERRSQGPRPLRAARGTASTAPRLSSCPRAAASLWRATPRPLRGPPRQVSWSRPKSHPGRCQGPRPSEVFFSEQDATRAQPEEKKETWHEADPLTGSLISEELHRLAPLTGEMANAFYANGIFLGGEYRPLLPHSYKTVIGSCLSEPRTIFGMPPVQREIGGGVGCMGKRGPRHRFFLLARCP
mmetsp:Transcript_62354/g.141027  ORF Transcript_62354/g.141027 Transcript_62354/m.141027 type:complete len:214 (-) Transcript_62354:84-725(-)